MIARAPEKITGFIQLQWLTHVIHEVAREVGQLLLQQVNFIDLVAGITSADSSPIPMQVDALAQRGKKREGKGKSKGNDESHKGHRKGTWKDNDEHISMQSLRLTRSLEARVLVLRAARPNFG